MHPLNASVSSFSKNCRYIIVNMLMCMCEYYEHVYPYVHICTSACTCTCIYVDA